MLNTKINLIMPLLSVTEHFAEASCKGWWFAIIIQVRNITESGDTEIRYSFAAFFSA